MELLTIKEEVLNNIEKDDIRPEEIDKEIDEYVGDYISHLSIVDNLCDFLKANPHMLQTEAPGRTILETLQYALKREVRVYVKNRL